MRPPCAPAPLQTRSRPRSGALPAVQSAGAVQRRTFDRSPRGLPFLSGPSLQFMGFIGLSSALPPYASRGLTDPRLQPVHRGPRSPAGAGRRLAGDRRS